jgi:hypothetical protein
MLTTSSMLHEYSTWPYVAQVFKLESQVSDARGTRTTVRPLYNRKLHLHYNL